MRLWRFYGGWWYRWYGCHGCHGHHGLFGALILMDYWYQWQWQFTRVSWNYRSWGRDIIYTKHSMFNLEMLFPLSFRYIYIYMKVISVCVVGEVLGVLFLGLLVRVIIMWHVICDMRVYVYVCIYIYLCKLWRHVEHVSTEISYWPRRQQTCPYTHITYINRDIYHI